MPKRLITERLTDERLAEICDYQLDHGRYDRTIDELVTEVERLRDVERDLRATIADEHSRLSQDLDREEHLRKELEELRKQLGKTRTEWGVRRGGVFNAMFSTLANEYASSEADARHKATDPTQRPGRVVSRVVGQWREVEAVNGDG